MIYVINFSYKVPDNAIVINTTSRAYGSWSRELSPFILGPVNLYDNYKSITMENAWQYSKVYEYYVDDNKNPTEEYFRWAQKGWNSKIADRYPMGKGVIPLYSYWAGEKLDYISARKKIYLPLYSTAVKDTEAFEKLKNIYSQNENIYLQDFDAHNLEPGSFKYDDLLNNKNIKFGHGYVLAMMLEGKI